MTLKDYAQNYFESTPSFIEAVPLVTTENIDVADHAGWTARQLVHHMADSESQAARACSLEILPGLNDEHLSNFAIRGELGRCTLEDWIHTYSGHPVDHANQLREAIGEKN